MLYPWIRRVVCKAHDVRHDREIADTVSVPIRVLARAQTLSEGCIADATGSGRSAAPVIAPGHGRQ
ncbi:hypothetical protein AA21291_2478 [Swaminathania salitolerans LMG 21291]|uniref:Uncharacterized protein n=1 Tax=Swaminathania salitolerans TaxID=182838 RepID=A0A511BMV4_9PROT|nr:hypothetical protein AA21291_2478 [Swaminathania salitolerans LMG 21291]GEL01667.1 hypothetical protein SSA02_08300 [Swaminathania salitolerans]